VDASALSPDGRLLHVVAFDQLPDRHLLTVDLVQRTVVHRQNLSDRVRDQGPNAASQIGGRSVAVSQDGGRLFVPGWTVDGAPMIAALDAHTYELVGTAGPLDVRPGGVTMLPPGEASPAARLVALAQRPGAPIGEAAHLFVIDPESVAIVDSMATPFDPRTVQLLPSPDGRYLYVSDVVSISLYDLAERRVTHRAFLPTAGAISMWCDGEEIYRADRQYDAVRPGEGRIFVFDRNLIPREDIDLSSYHEGASPRSSPLSWRVWMDNGCTFFQVRTGPEF
jgi:DNA-binding beta-propeller fold protein YncE